MRIRKFGEDCANPGVETGFTRAISDPPVEGVEGGPSLGRAVEEGERRERGERVGRRSSGREGRRNGIPTEAA